MPQAVLDQPWLQPVYDEPEFVVRNIWRLYGGWYDGNPARLKPAPDAAVAAEVAALAGGVDALAARAAELAAAGDLRLAAQLAEWAVRRRARRPRRPRRPGRRLRRPPAPRSPRSWPRASSAPRPGRAGGGLIRETLKSCREVPTQVLGHPA